MRTLTHTLYYPSRSVFYTLYHLTDLHVGARACCETLLGSMVREIQANPYALWIGGGDYIDAIARRGDPRYDEETLARWLLGENDVVGQQRDYLLTRFLLPIADRCLGLVMGNHERTSVRYYDRDVYWEICQRVAEAAGRDPAELALGVEGFLVLKFRRGERSSYGGTRTLTIYTHHGHGGGRLPGAHALALGRVMSDYEADLALLGHRHVKMVLSKRVVTAGGKTCRSRMRYGAFMGSFLDSYIEPSGRGKPADTYASHAGFPPQEPGTIPILIKPDGPRFEFRLAENGVMLRAAADDIPALLAA
jgi:hypothetical protein